MSAASKVDNESNMSQACPQTSQLVGQETIKRGGSEELTESLAMGRRLFGLGTGATRRPIESSEQVGAGEWPLKEQEWP